MCTVRVRSLRGGRWSLEGTYLEIQRGGGQRASPLGVGGGLWLEENSDMGGRAEGEEDWREGE